MIFVDQVYCPVCDHVCHIGCPSQYRDTLRRLSCSGDGWPWYPLGLMCDLSQTQDTNKSPLQWFFFLYNSQTFRLDYLYLYMEKIWSSIHLVGWIKSDCLGKPRKIYRKQKVNNICLASLWLKYPENIPDSIPDGSSPAPSIAPLTFSRRGILIKFSVSGQHSTVHSIFYNDHMMKLKCMILVHAALGFLKSSPPHKTLSHHCKTHQLCLLKEVLFKDFMRKGPFINYHSL